MDFNAQRLFIRGILENTDHTVMDKELMFRRPHLVIVAAGRESLPRVKAWMKEITGVEPKESPETFYNDKLAIIFGRGGNRVGRMFTGKLLTEAAAIPEILDIISTNLHIAKNQVTRGILKGDIEEDLRACWDFLVTSDSPSPKWFSFGQDTNRLMLDAVARFTPKNGLYRVNSRTKMETIPPGASLAVFRASKGIAAYILEEIGKGRKVMIFGHLPRCYVDKYAHYVKPGCDNRSSDSSGEGTP